MPNSRNEAAWNNTVRPWIADYVRDTPVGIVVSLSQGSRVLAVGLGLRSMRAARAFVRERARGLNVSEGASEAGRQLRQYFALRRRDFELTPVLDGMSTFQRRALEACAKVGYGRTVTYGELARMAGSHGAARAVGQAMKRNPTPIIVPCHRVLAAHSVGGYSAAGGVTSKRALLSLEGLSASAD